MSCALLIGLFPNGLFCDLRGCDEAVVTEVLVAAGEAAAGDDWKACFFGAMLPIVDEIGSGVERSSGQELSSCDSF